MDVSTSGSISGSKSVSCSLSWADRSRVHDSAQGRDVCEYAYPVGKLMIWRRWAPEVLPLKARGIPGRGGVGSGVGSGACCLSWLGEGAPVLLRLQLFCGYFALPFWQGRHLGVWFWWSIARCLSIAAFTFLSPGNSTPHFFSSRTLVQSVLIRYCVSAIAARKNTSLAILVIFKARRMSDCSSCTGPPCLAIVADILNTNKKLVAASNNEMRLLPQPHTNP